MLGRIDVGRGIPDAPHVELTAPGVVLCDVFGFVNRTNENVRIDKYIVMPNHVHFIAVAIDAKAKDGASGSRALQKPCPANAVIPKLISSIKRFTNKQVGFSLWQDSYHDHIIRDEDDYLHIWEYIENNPAKWQEDQYYVP